MTKLSVFTVFWCIFYVSSFKPDEEILAILEDGAVLDLAAHYLQGKYDLHDCDTQVVKLLPDPHTTLGMSFQVVTWDDKTERFISHGANKQINKFTHGVKSRIRVIGHGRKNGGTVTMGGLTHDTLANVLATLVDPVTKKVDRISMVGCSLFGNQQKSCNFTLQGPQNEFPINVLEALRSKGIQTQISARTGLVGVHESGKIAHGERINDKVVWYVKEGTIKKVLLQHTETNNLKSSFVSVKSKNVYRPPIPLPKDKKQANKVSVTRNYIDIEYNGGHQTPYHVTLTNDDVFKVLEKAAENIFHRYVVVPNDWDSKITKQRKVKMIDGTVKDLPVRELNGVEDLMKEIKYWGELGFEYPYRDKVSRQKITTTKAGTPMENRVVYHRFGKFVLSLKVQSETNTWYQLQPFYCNLVGIIGSDSEDPLPHIRSTRYSTIQARTNEEFFPDAIRFLSGDNENIKTGEGNAYNAVVAMALLLSESIRDWRQPIINVLLFDLYHNLPVEEFGRNIFFFLEPMARGAAGPARFSGMRYELYKEPWWCKFRDAHLKAHYANVIKEWVSADFEDIKQGIRKRSPNSGRSDSSPAKKVAIQEHFMDSLTEVVMNFDPEEPSGLIQPQPTLAGDIAGPLYQGDYEMKPDEYKWLPLWNQLALSEPYITNIIDYKISEKDGQPVIYVYERIKHDLTFDERTGIWRSHDVWNKYELKDIDPKRNAAHNIFHKTQWQILDHVPLDYMPEHKALDNPLDAVRIFNWCWDVWKTNLQINNQVLSAPVTGNKQTGTIGDNIIGYLSPKGQAVCLASLIGDVFKNTLMLHALSVV